MLHIRDHLIAITKGDTIDIAIGLDGMTFPSGTMATFTVKVNPEQPEPSLVQTKPIEDGAVLFSFSAAQTQLRSGFYQWDLRIVQDGRVITPMCPASFRVLEVIGHAF